MQQKQDPVPESRMSGFSMPKESKVSESSSSFEISEEMMEESRKVEFEKPIQKEEKNAPTYEERLKESKIGYDEAMQIIDDLTVKGFYRETVKVSRKLSATFTSRPTRFNSYLAEVIDIADPKKVARMQQLMTEYQLACSLVKYGDTELPDLNSQASEKEWQDTIQAKLKYIRSLPAPVFLSLCNLVSKFDLKLMIIFGPGYEENF